MQPIRHSATALLVGASAAAALSVADSPGASSPDPAAQRAVAALVSGSATAAQAAVPADFTRTMGYTPVLDGDSITNPAGSCSSPVPLPEGFEEVCRQHDYGYDLLRYAEAVGGTLPAGAREALDDQFGQEARRSCRGTGPRQDSCTAWARIATASLRANSWRQHDSVPDPEDPLSLATGGAALLALGAAGSLLAGWVRLTGRRVVPA